jgi:hypothetical protein
MISSPSLSCARASSEEQTDGEPRPPLCRDCQQIDFQPLLDIDIAHLQKQPDGIALADLGTRCNVLEHENVCPLCQLFHESRVKRKKSPRTYELRIYSYLKTAEKITFKSCTKQQLQRQPGPQEPCFPSGQTTAHGSSSPPKVRRTTAKYSNQSCWDLRLTWKTPNNG